MHKNVDLSGEAFDQNSKHDFSMGEQGGPSEINYVRLLLYKRGGARPKSTDCGCQGFHSFGCNDVDNFISEANKYSQLWDFWSFFSKSFCYERFETIKLRVFPCDSFSLNYYFI